MIQVVVLLAELAYLFVLLAECAEHSHAAEIFPCFRENDVELLLNLPVKRYCREHYCENDKRQNRNYADKDHCRAFVDRKGTNHGAENDERRTEEETQGEIYAGLNLIYVACKPGYEGRFSRFIDLRISEAHYVCEECLSDL